MLDRDGTGVIFAGQPLSASRLAPTMMSPEAHERLSDERQLGVRSIAWVGRRRSRLTLGSQSCRKQEEVVA